MKKCVVIDHTEENLRALQDTIYVIGGKWKLPILFALGNGKKRFLDIKRDISGISTRMLSLNLKEMEINKLVKRSACEDTREVIEYECTEYAKDYAKLMKDMIEWGKEHRRVIIA
ncbi:MULTISPECIES: winged helix-turn-helix transcriptional regulator [Chryseobacterium]|uniref:winged helix-turn-helix transcriptional regulator n=1 Tax=Chryseobacterium TaxID=59732 RepID=UPI001BEB94F8|nr:MULTISPECIES: helix-turn-helix domain-containing protein [Chryseobacterium]MBT2619769.1 helix-turn-helix transcriptional regulator [Chryseobacterium sp. ISL-6]